MSAKKIRIGTRGSQLARWQAAWVASQLAQHEIETELVLLQTQGDEKSGPIGNIGSQGVFTKEIQRALLEDRVDLAVHSLKDLPTDTPDGLVLAAVPKRAACGDALISSKVKSLDQLPNGAVVATGSARRRAQLLAFRSDLDVQDLRGNVDTRLQKLEADESISAIVLAEAGLRRLGLDHHIAQVIPKAVMLPAVGQGALGLETRADDMEVRASLARLNDQATYHSVLAERALLRSLRGGCLAPIGAWARPHGADLKLDAVVLNADGSQKVQASSIAPANQCEELGNRLADELIAQGASQLLADARI